MRKAMLIAALAGSAIVGQMAQAVTPDDVKWINKCVGDNKREGATKDVVLKYCTCMNEKMDDNETQSITAWEKTHPEEQKACEEVAGWK